MQYSYLKLFARHWSPAENPPQGQVLLQHTGLPLPGDNEKREARAHPRCSEGGTRDCDGQYAPFFYSGKNSAKSDLFFFAEFDFYLLDKGKTCKKSDLLVSCFK